jgi:molybdate transport system substrate-binding protein
LRRVLVVGLTLALTTAACSSGPQDENNRLVVFGAASLTEAFSDIAAAYEDEHPGVVVVLSFASSSDLAAQIEQGAQADVFASADEAIMARLSDQDLTEGAAQILASNRLEIIVEPGNPKGITGLGDLADGDLILSLAAPEVPAGKYAAQALDKAGIQVQPDSFEVDVKAVVTRVALGEADVGIVYASDVRSAGSDIEGVEIPADQNVIALYPISELRGSSTDAAAAFIAFVLSDEGRSLLAERGFGAP